MPRVGPISALAVKASALPMEQFKHGLWAMLMRGEVYRDPVIASAA